MKINVRFHLCCVCIVALMVAGCGVKRPDAVISETTMENLLYDYHLAKAMGENLSYGDNYKKALYTEAVFQKYATTQAVFDSSMVWYTRHTEVLSKIYEKVNKRMKETQNANNHLIALRDQKPTMSMPGDSIDVWPWRRTLRFTPKGKQNQYAFVLPADTNYKDRDTLVWQVQYHFLQPASVLQAATMAMQVIYEKDTLSRIATITRSGMQQIRLFADTLGAIKEIKGFIYYAKDSVHTNHRLLVDRLSLTRYHCTDSLSAAARDSVNKVQALKIDSLQKKVAATSADSLSKAPKKDASRLTPEKLNHRRTGTQREKRPEQIEVEQNIQEERKERQMIQRRNQQRRTNQRQ